MSDPSPNTAPPDRFIPTGMGADDSYNARLSQQLRTAEARIEQLEAALREVGEMLADIDDPKTASGHCMFCGHRIGTSVFGVDLYIKHLHEPNCAWLTLRALEGGTDE